MKPLIIALTGVAVVFAVASGQVSAQGRGGDQGGGRATTGTGPGGGGGAVAAGAGGGGNSGGGGGFGSGVGPAAQPTVSSGGGSSSGPSGPMPTGSSGRSYVSPGSTYSGRDAGGRVSPTDGNSSYVRDLYGSPGDRAVPRGSRPNPGAPTVGQAGLRTNPPVHGPGGGGGYGGWYPYYPYYGWGYGYGYYGYYDPWWWGWGWGWSYPVVVGGGYYGNEPIGRGGLKLRVEPTNAEVYVDGYYMGIVDDFDGTFQKMDLEVGAHHVEIRAPGYQTIAIDVRIEFAETVTYRGAMQPLSKK